MPFSPCALVDVDLDDRPNAWMNERVNQQASACSFCHHASSQSLALNFLEDKWYICVFSCKNFLLLSPQLSSFGSSLDVCIACFLISVWFRMWTTSSSSFTILFLCGLFNFHSPLIYYQFTSSHLTSSAMNYKHMPNIYSAFLDLLIGISFFVL